MVLLNPIANKSLREHVLDTLRDAILNGELKPGRTLVESELATQLGVSRAPLREALQILSTEGLIETIPYRGTTVKRLAKKDIEELYSLRSVLESFAIQLIIDQNNPEHIQKLRQHFESMLNAAKANDLKVLNQIDRDFHDSLIELSNHSLLISLWVVVAMRVRQVMALRNKRFTDITEIAYNHLAIIEAIAAKDQAKAVALITDHVASVGDLIAEDWDDSQNLAAD
ncbi:MAG: GntR family transcriptional regulator [Chloroflexi bacterium]|nr:GntR family transcriptional regulator [Chloroflexota bacterium]MCC6893158.1 GntR family transcriptional regulator [Anaerolineae bacterium]